jgi:hypothetical protein
MSSYPSRPAKTAADYLAMAAGPVLIMVMVGALVFFLLEATFRGEFSGRVRWILFWFTLASVLVSRISIEQGKSYGAVYGIALGLATAIRLVQFIGFHMGAFLFLALTWWCASKLVWDCTLIDEDEDASGEGLWDRARIGRPRRDNPNQSKPESPTGGAAFANPRREQRPHAPGLWIVYFSLGALPVFGIGQLLIPADDAESRTRAFMLLWSYVASALGLLLTTSFLGLRRYLRQRHLVMPPTMARSWLARGSALGLAVLLGALFLPRPQGAATLARVGDRILSREQKASRHALTRGEAAEGEGRRIGESEDEGEGRREREAGERQEGQRSDGDRTEQGSEGEDGAEQSDTTPESRAQRAAGSSREGAQPAPPPGPPSGMPRPDVAWLRWLMLAVGVFCAAILIRRFGRGWLEAWRKTRRPAKKPRPRAASAAERRPAGFGAFRNPFRTGLAQRMPPAELVVYTFDALEAWATDRACRRREEQTPVEFGQQVAAEFPNFAEEILGTVRLYVRVAYGGRNPSRADLGVLEGLWSALEAAPVGLRVAGHQAEAARR